METLEYENIFNIESDHWWYKGLHDLVISTVNEVKSESDNFCILDAGCGTGAVLKKLGVSGTNVGVDISKEAISFCKVRELSNILNASVSSLPFSDNSFDLIVSLDVIYHQYIEDDVAVLKEFHRVLKDNGRLILNLPAHNYLWRSHDDYVYTKQRYNKNELYNKLIGSNYKIIKLSYRNIFLFPIVFAESLLYKAKKNKVESNSDLKKINKIINLVLYLFLKLENKILNTMNLPIGTSLFCIAQK